MSVRIKNIFYAAQHGVIHGFWKKKPLIFICRTFDPWINHKSGVARIDVNAGMTDVLYFHGVLIWSYCYCLESHLLTRKYKHYFKVVDRVGFERAANTLQEKFEMKGEGRKETYTEAFIIPGLPSPLSFQSNVAIKFKFL